MQDFDQFLKLLLKNPNPETVLQIRGEKKKIKAMAKYSSKNYKGEEYIKIIFDDGSFLLVVINEKEVYYANKIEHHIKEIPDEIIGKKERINYKGKIYKLANKDDYQYVVRFYVGTIFDIEGEVKFSDYYPSHGPKEFLSLGWSVCDGKRSDINPLIINLKEIVL